MPTSLDELIYQTTQKMRSAWYSAHYVVAMRSAPSIEGPPEGTIPSWRTVYGDLNDLLERDWENVREGLYPAPLPADTGPITSARKSFAFFRDLTAVNRRREAGDGQEVFNSDVRGRYPRYFLQNFHYQSGGYLTDESAALYDHQVEVLFVGGADAMRRQCLGALTAFLQTTAVRKANHLDIACGTG
ncbi:MAG: ubiquinone biosynthesis methyltransferase UbiE, partial [Pseudomonadota bacterium]|nr:ubiquinone biosynthesis methyltransferase UbiE [Pseudomonadota bacterium]